MNYDIETIIWAATLLAAGVALYVVARAMRRWIRHGENLDILAPELATRGAIDAQAFSKQRAMLGKELIASAKELPEHEREIVHHALWHAMLLEAASDGSIDAREVRFVVDFFGELSGRAVASEAAIEAAERLAARPQAAIAEIAKAQGASYPSRQHILEAAFLVSLADGELIESEANRLGDISDVLGFSLAERQGIYTELTNRLED